MIDCPNGEVRDLLPDYLHGRLESSVRQSVERHLAECAACRDELELLRDLRGTLGRAPRIDVATIAAAIPPYSAPVQKGWRRRWRTAAAIAAIAVGGSSIALLAHLRQPTQVAEGPVVRPVAPAPDAGVHAVAPAAPVTPQPTVEPAPTVAHVAPPVTRAPAPRGEELAVAGGAIDDLSDGELSALLNEIESLDAVPSTEVESSESMVPTRHRGRL